MSELFQVSSSFRVVCLRVHGYFKWIKSPWWSKSLTLRVHLLLVFQDVVQYFFELYWSCCHWAVVSDSLLWVGSHWLEALELVFDCSCCLLFPQIFTSSLRNDAHPFMVITWWALNKYTNHRVCPVPTNHRVLYQSPSLSHRVCPVPAISL